MKYKDILGYSKPKKKLIKEKVDKKLSITEELKKEFGPVYEWTDTPSQTKRWSKKLGGNGLTEYEQLKEVGAGVQYRKFYKDIERQQKGLSKSVQKFKQYLEVQGLKSKARELEDNYLIDSYGWMRKWLKKFIEGLM